MWQTLILPPDRPTGRGTFKVDGQPSSAHGCMLKLRDKKIPQFAYLQSRERFCHFAPYGFSSRKIKINPTAIRTRTM